ncbi:MAG: hypothetical protein WAS54_01435 [Scrofimicrobium sp.]
MDTATSTARAAEELAFADPRRELTTLDRCDVCDARAWVRAVMKTSELLFCAHHGSQHIEALQDTALFVQDDRALLLEDA